MDRKLVKGAVEAFREDFDSGFATLALTGRLVDPSLATIKCIVLESIVQGEAEMAFYATRCLARYGGLAMEAELESMPVSGKVN